MRNASSILSIFCYIFGFLYLDYYIYVECFKDKPAIMGWIMVIPICVQVYSLFKIVINNYGAIMVLSKKIY